MAGNQPGAKLALDLSQQRQGQQIEPRLPQQQQGASASTNYEIDTPRPPAATDRGFDAVTPGLPPSHFADGRAFNSQYADEDDSQGRDSSPSYFSQADPKIPRRPLLGVDGLLQRKVTTANMGRRESLSEIRTTHPDLSLSGNIISATFNIPHAFTYRKGGDWVRFSF
jgi:hypothetical protein